MQATSLKPLSGMRILVTRPIQQSQNLSEKLRQLGASPVELPTIEIAPIENADSLDRALRRLGEYDWVIFTSAHGVNFVLKRMSELRIEYKALQKVKVATIGPATASALDQVGRRPDFIPAEYLSEKIAQGLGEVNGKRILLLRADISSNILPAQLGERGALVDNVVAYRTIIPRNLTPERLRSVFDGGVDLVTFTSPSTVRNLAQVLEAGELGRFLRNAKVACIGPVTVEAVKEMGIHVDIVARHHTVDSLVEAIVDEIRTV
jgi:uroporphyrinogen-III synthase